MKRILGFVAIASLVLATSLFSAPADSKLNSDESDFVNKAAQGGNAEVQLGKLAQEKGVDPAVKSFGARMVKDHTAANQKLSALAMKKGVDLPDGKGISNDATYLKLKVLSGKEFDKSYVDSMVEDHQEDVKEFTRVSESATDPDVKAFATKTLPTLKMHLRMIESIQQKMGK